MQRPDADEAEDDKWSDPKAIALGCAAHPDGGLKELDRTMPHWAQWVRDHAHNDDAGE